MPMYPFKFSCHVGTQGYMIVIEKLKNKHTTSINLSTHKYVYGKLLHEIAFTKQSTYQVCDEGY